MDKQKFDALTRAFATGSSRRTAIKGIFGGTAVVAVGATRFGRAGAAECSPETVLDDCTLGSECQNAVCLSGACVYVELCDEGDVCCGGVCAECCSDDDCTGCDVCSEGICVTSCTACEICNDGACYYDCDGVCCDGACIEGGQCCDVADCLEPVATFCSSVDCIDNMCTVIPECPVNQFCCGYGEEGAYCAFCCEDDQCEQPGICADGHCEIVDCLTDADCYGTCTFCSSDHVCLPILCVEGYTCCGNGECIPEDECCKGIGDICGLLEPTGLDGSPQDDCCDGLVCCDGIDAMGPVCAECCADYDCPKGAYCHGGWCEYPDYCDDDKECPKGTCCCKDGTCSGKCCHHPHPPKPPKPPKPAPDAPVTTLPATGVGEGADSTGLFGAAALGAAAALYAAKKMRNDEEPSQG